VPVTFPSRRSLLETAHFWEFLGVAQFGHISSQSTGFLLAPKYFGDYVSILGDAHAKSDRCGRFANNRHPWVHLALFNICRYFYSETIPLKRGKLSVYGENCSQEFC
jgi:hypothetical protein